jgi:hypothetical protein
VNLDTICSVTLYMLCGPFIPRVEALQKSLQGQPDYQGRKCDNLPTNINDHSFIFASIGPMIFLTVGAWFFGSSGEAAVTIRLPLHHFSQHSAIAILK